MHTHRFIFCERSEMHMLLHLTYLIVEELVLRDIEVHCEETRLQGGAEGVALHQANLGVGRLVTEQVFPGRNHVLQNLKRMISHENTINADENTFSSCISHKKSSTNSSNLFLN